MGTIGGYRDASVDLRGDIRSLAGRELRYTACPICSRCENASLDARGRSSTRTASLLHLGL